MKESIKTIVVCRQKDDEKQLEISFEDNVISFIIDGKELFAADWEGNFEDVFKRAIDIWKSKKE